MARDWEPVIDPGTLKPSGEYRPATVCHGLAGCKTSRRRSLGCMLEPQHHEAHPDGAVCAGWLRANPAWPQWTFAIKSARVSTAPLTLPHVFVLAARWYDANLK